MFLEEFFELFIALHHPFEDSMCSIFIIIQKWVRFQDLLARLGAGFASASLIYPLHIS